MFTLEALPAKHGDCLILHYGPPASPRFVLIDGGPPGVYKKALAPRLTQLRDRFSPGAELPLELVMVSHIDDDHIAGIESVLKALTKPGPVVRVSGLWHNAFTKLIDAATPAQADSVVHALAGAGVPAPTGAVIASIPQGARVAKLATELGIRRNLGKPLMLAGATTNLPGGLTLRVIAPSQERIDQLRAAWAAEIKAGGPGGVVPAAYIDDSAWNLSSIVAVATFQKRTMLFTGDARGDHIIEGLRAAGLLRTTRPAHFDVLKVPHHGSDRNVETDFFRKVTADNYVVSGNGEYGNPESATLTMIAEARQDAHYKLWCTYSDGKDNLGSRLKSWDSGQRQAGRKSVLGLPAKNGASSLLINADPAEGVLQ